MARGRRQGRLAVAACLVALAALAAAIGQPSPSPAAAAGLDAFYDVPDPLPPGAPGDLIRSEVVPGISGIAATTYKVMYHSRSIAGDDIAVTGLILVPTAPMPEGGWPVISWAHGTTGTADVCAPSIGGLGGSAATLAKAAVAAGYLFTATDYEGLGTPGLHPYLVGESEGRAVVDIVRAARNLPGSPGGTRFAIWGHSQGGHAALWANQVAATWAPELTDVGAVAMAPASHLTLEWDFEQAQHRTNNWQYLVMLLAGLHATHPDAPLSRVFTPAGLAALGVVDTGCSADVTTAFKNHDGVYWFGRNPSADRVFGPLMRNSEPGQVPVGAPVLIAQGGKDSTVPVAVTGALLDDMCRIGAVVHEDVYPSASHGSTPASSLSADLAWFAARFAGDPPPDDCGPRVGTEAERQFLEAVHADLVGRPPSWQELDAAAGAPVHLAVADGLLGTEEAAGVVVDATYLRLAGNHGDDPGVGWWSRAIAEGRRNRANLVSGLLARTSYYEGPGGGTDARWVQAVYREVFHRAADPGGLASWTRAVARDGRERSAARLLASPEGRRSRVRELYAQYLDATPDPSGLAFWTGRLATRGERYVIAGLVGGGQYQRLAAARFPGA